jgi:hydroxymethylglutaryl-CoA synthase
MDIGMEEPTPKDPRGTIESIISDSEFMSKDSEFTKRFAKTDAYQEIYENKVASSLIASTSIGNLYTASLYLGFRSCLEYEFQKGVDLEGKRFGFASYGSGSSAMVFSGVIQPEHLEIVRDMNLETEIGNRTKLSLEQYEELHENKRTPDQSILSGKKEFILEHVEIKSSDKRGERRYTFVE